MAQTAPSANQTDNRAAPANPTPPDERFWQRYSPHAEFPLSSVGSFVVHLLLFGLLALAAWLGMVLFDRGNRSLPVEAVRLELGGGGGNPHATGEGANNGPVPEEAGTQANEERTDNPPPVATQAPKLNVEANPRVKPEFDDSPARIIHDPKASTSDVINGLRNRLAQIKSGSSSGRGKGGPGSGGGSGGGQGTGIGNGTGPGVATPTQREKRMRRWTMKLSVNNSQDYVAQLAGLGAILAIPVREGPNGAEYEIVRNLLARPTKLLKENVKDLEIERMFYWIPEEPDTVQGVMSVLGLQLRPSHFVAFMPPAFEKKMFELELAYLHRRHPNRSEDDIASTKFQIRVRGGKYEPVVIEQTLGKK